MATIAVAGGTDGLGLTIVEALAVQGKHDVVILSRKGGAELQNKLPYRLVVVDYTNVESLTKVLESNDVGTVIATINALGNSTPERNLIQAAEKSSKTSRFIPSTFACFDYLAKYADSSLLAKTKQEVVEELDHTSLTYMSIISGWFVDYYGTALLQSHAHRYPMFVDIVNRKAAIPGSGDEPIAFTRLIDIARYVVQALDLDNWPRKGYVIGDSVTWHEFVQLAENARGSKFDVTYDTVDALEARQATDLPCYADFYQKVGKEAGSAMVGELGVWMARGELAVKPEFSLNEAFPEIKPMTVKEYLNLSWKV